MDEAAASIELGRLERHKDEEGVIGLRYGRNIVTVVNDKEEVEDNKLRVMSSMRLSSANGAQNKQIFRHLGVFGVPEVSGVSGRVL